MGDPYDLDRFVQAQAANYGDALSELRAGRKRTHWSWYVFPQIRGLGSSAMSLRYAIGSLAEAAAYLEHPTLGPRLRESVAALNGHRGIGIEHVLGHIDALKFRSCLTLFAQAAPGEPLFREALNQHFGGQPDAATLAILARQHSAT
jgi:uncharacterized protein (DUF1810 family)